MKISCSLLLKAIQFKEYGKTALIFQRIYPFGLANLLAKFPSLIMLAVLNVPIIPMEKKERIQFSNTKRGIFCRL